MKIKLYIFNFCSEITIIFKDDPSISIIKRLLKLFGDLVSMYSNIFHLLDIFAKSIEAGDQSLRVASTLDEHFLRRTLVRIEKVPRFRGADIILTDMNALSKNLLLELIEKLSNNSLMMVLNAIIGINLWPELAKELNIRGFIRSLLPIDNGIGLFIRRGYGVDFFRKTVEVYRKSFIYGPNPIDYNTAYTLYSLAKFLTARRRGVIVEVGTGRGFSTLWLVHAAKETNSYVISIDNKCDRVDYTKNVLKNLNLEDHVEILCTDAKNYDRGSKDIVYVFIDGKKDEYHLYLEALEPYLLPGALILAHNTLSDAHVIKPYIEKVYRKPYKSITIATDPKGLTISVYMK